MSYVAPQVKRDQTVLTAVLCWNEIWHFFGCKTRFGHPAPAIKAEPPAHQPNPDQVAAGMAGSILVLQQTSTAAAFFTHLDMNSNEAMYLPLVDVACDAVTSAVTVPAPRAVHHFSESRNGVKLALNHKFRSQPRFQENETRSKGDGGTIANGRLALADIRLSNAALLTVSLWSRNLFNEAHLYNRSLKLSNRLTGFFNQPRTYRVDFKIKM
jgi:iron complex outermembrane receptor protein